MNILNEGEIIINDKTRAGEVAQIMVTAGLYDAIEDVPVYENDGTTPKEAGISIHEVYGNIDTALQEVADKCKEAGINLNGQVCYSGDYYGRYYITDNVVEDLTADEIGVREATNEELIAELKRRGLEVTAQKNQLSESEKSADLPALCAYDIKWDTDGDAKVFNGLPERMLIPNGLVDNDMISDYLSDEIGYCHAGFKIGIMFRGSILPYYTNWLDSDTFQMWFGEDIFRDPEGDSYLIKFEKHLKDNEWVVEIIWEDDCTTINQICNADDYITANEIWKIERICEKMIQPDSNEVPETDGKGNSAIELGKTYQFAGYKWTACELINKGKTLVIQSHGVTHGKWPGFKMEKFGNGNYYSISIDGEDISSYDDKMKELYDAIKDAEDSSTSYGKGLFLISKEKAGFTEWGKSGSGNYWQTLKEATENAPLFGAAYSSTWLGTAYGGTYAWYVNRGGGVYYGNSQDYNDFVVAPAFNLDLSKVEIVGDEIIKKAQPAPSSFEHDDNCQEHQLLGKTYKFAGYKWTVCELVNNGKTAVIQSHGVTRGAWPGFVMPQFGNGNYYPNSIDGHDISKYDNKTQALYDTIKDVEDKSAPYGKGLYLVSKEKAGFTEWGEPGSDNYWEALKTAATDFSSIEPSNEAVWLSTVDNSIDAWYIYCNGRVYNNYNQRYDDLVIAPAFNLDLSKVEIKGDEIIIKQVKKQQTLEIDKMLTISSRHVSADTKDLLDQAADDNEEDPMPPVYEKQGYGWFVACDPDNEETWDNYPADLVQCMKLARNNGCFWLCLDADGPRVETLEFFD